MLAPPQAAEGRGQRAEFGPEPGLSVGGSLVSLRSQDKPIGPMYRVSFLGGDTWRVPSCEVPFKKYLRPDCGWTEKSMAHE